jgi:hypothetical protein
MRGYRLVRPEGTGPDTTFFVDSNYSLRTDNIHANWASGFSLAILKASLVAWRGLDAIIGSIYRPGFGMAADQTLAEVGCRAGLGSDPYDDKVVDHDSMIHRANFSARSGATEA